MADVNQNILPIVDGIEITYKVKAFEKIKFISIMTSTIKSSVYKTYKNLDEHEFLNPI